MRSTNRVLQIIKGAFRPFQVSATTELWGKQVQFRVLDEREDVLLQRKGLRTVDLVSGPKLFSLINQCRLEMEQAGHSLDAWTLPPAEGGPRAFSRQAQQLDQPRAP